MVGGRKHTTECRLMSISAGKIDVRDGRGRVTFRADIRRLVCGRSCGEGFGEI